MHDPRGFAEAWMRGGELPALCRTAHHDPRVGVVRFFWTGLLRGVCVCEGEIV